jgi:erythromycin esterase
MFALLRWMRDYNQNPTHTRKLKFYGFDMQTPGLAESNVLDYLRRVDPEIVNEATRSFDVLGRWGENKDYEAASAEVKKRTADSLALLLRRFDERQAGWVLRSNQHDWTMARQNMVVVKQADGTRLPSETGTTGSRKTPVFELTQVCRKDTVLWQKGFLAARTPPAKRNIASGT